MADRPSLSAAELTQFYDRISVPISRRRSTVTDLSPTAQLEYLDYINKHYLCSVPWENLTQHYSWHKIVLTKPTHLIRKIAHNPGRGGYCMETNSFFHLALAALGYDTYLAGSRIWLGHKFGGWTHVVNLVRVEGRRYLVDGGYGGAGPCGRVCLDETAPHGTMPVPQVAPAESRLVYRPMAQARDQTQKVWVYEFRWNAEATWIPQYCFVDTEFTIEDVEVMNLDPWSSRHTFFTHKVVAARFSTDRERDDGEGLPGSPGEAELEGEIDGTITLNQDVLKWRRRGKKVLELKFATDLERQAAIEKYFGIKFLPEDLDGIVGTAAEIGARVPASQF